MKVIAKESSVKINGSVEKYTIEVRLNQYSDFDLRVKKTSDLLFKMKRWHLILARCDKFDLTIERRAKNFELSEVVEKIEIELRDSISLYFNNEIVPDSKAISSVLQKGFAIKDIKDDDYKSDVILYEDHFLEDEEPKKLN